MQACSMIDTGLFLLCLMGSCGILLVSIGLCFWLLEKKDGHN